MPSSEATKLVCLALNRVFWKCPQPQYVCVQADNEDDAVNSWANYWLAELRDGPAERCITGIVWDAHASEFRPQDGWIVQRWSQYRLGSAPFTRDPAEDKWFPSEQEADLYALRACSGIGGDMRYRYNVVPTQNYQ